MKRKALGSKAYRRHRSTGTFGTFFIPSWIALAGVYTIVAASDLLFDLGWGYTRKDASGGLGVVAFGFAFWFIWTWLHVFLGKMNETIFGRAEIDEETARDDTPND